MHPGPRTRVVLHCAGPPPLPSLPPRRFVDPADPTTIYLSQPVGREAQLPAAPKYAASYGQDDDKYEPMAPGH